MTGFRQQPDTIVASYLAALMTGNQMAALQVVHEALAVGMSLEDLYQEVLQPALYDIGRLWENGQLNVANEHIATAITRSVMERCVSVVKPLLAGPPSIIATCAGPELHDIGLRMVADCLELNGWNTLYLGPNMPLDAIVALAIQHRVDLIAVSITVGNHTRYVRDLITSLRQSAIGPTAKVLVGGQLFNRIPELWRQVGADGTAADLTGAIAWVRTHVYPHEGHEEVRLRDVLRERRQHS